MIRDKIYHALKRYLMKNPYAPDTLYLGLEEKLDLKLDVQPHEFDCLDPLTFKGMEVIDVDRPSFLSVSRMEY